MILSDQGIAPGNYSKYGKGNMIYLTIISSFVFVTVHEAHGWVGWRNTKNGRPLILEFMFGGTTPRVFKSVTLTTYCQLDLGIQSFSQMLAYFSIKTQSEPNSEGLLNYHPQYLKSVNRRDLIDYQPQNITLDLDDRVGNAVKLELYFENKWLLLSEIQFESQLASDLDIISNNYHSEIIDDNSDDEIEDFHEKTINEEKSSKPMGTPNEKDIIEDSQQIILSDTPEQDQDIYKKSDNVEVTKGKKYILKTTRKLL